MKKIIYFLYYIKITDYSKLRKFSKFVAKKGKSKISQFFDVIFCSFKYNMSFLEYYYFRFWEKNNKERNEWAGTGFMFEYQLKMNPKQYRNLLENKVLFLKEYKDFICHKWADIPLLKNNEPLANEIRSNSSGKIVLKGINEQCGKGIKIIDTNQISSINKLIEMMEKNKQGLVEEYIIQHDKLNELSPAGLNTVRVFTQLNQNGGVDFLGARLRITVNSYVDNLAAGNLAAPIDMETGKISGPAVYSDITKKSEEIHPVTKVKIIDFEIPFWQEVKNLCIQAALHNTYNKSIGWDVAINNNWVELLEGNHNWCKLLWQLPINQGMKKVLLKYL